MKHSYYYYAVAMLGFTLLTPVALAQPMTITPPAIMESNGITYVTGGIGDEEREMMESMKSDYNLHITSASRSGAYKGVTDITLYNRDGGEILMVEDISPLFYAQLPPGQYKIMAVNQGHEIRKNFTVGQRPATINLTW